MGSQTPTMASSPPPIQRPQQVKEPNLNIQNQLSSRRDLLPHGSPGPGLEVSLRVPALGHVVLLTVVPGQEAVQICSKIHVPAVGGVQP